MAAAPPPYRTALCPRPNQPGPQYVPQWTSGRSQVLDPDPRLDPVDPAALLRGLPQVRDPRREIHHRDNGPRPLHPQPTHRRRIHPATHTGINGITARSELAELNLDDYPAIQIALGNTNNPTDAEMIESVDRSTPTPSPEASSPGRSISQPQDPKCTVRPRNSPQPAEPAPPLCPYRRTGGHAQPTHKPAESTSRGATNKRFSALTGC